MPYLRACACIKREISSRPIKMLLARHLACRSMLSQNGSLATHAYSWIFQLSPQCSMILMLCKLLGKIENCSQLFEFRKTQDGFCCTYNYVRESDDIPMWVSSRIFGSSPRRKSCGGYLSSQINESHPLRLLSCTTRRYFVFFFATNIHLPTWAKRIPRGDRYVWLCSRYSITCLHHYMCLLLHARTDSTQVSRLLPLLFVLISFQMHIAGNYVRIETAREWFIPPLPINCNVRTEIVDCIAGK